LRGHQRGAIPKWQLQGTAQDMLKKLTLIGLLGVTTVALSACGGGRTSNENTMKTTTVGQELTDLQAAYDNGIITEKEYEKKKKEILK
jgi:uncharacterized membrane protein